MKQLLLLSAFLTFGTLSIHAQPTYCNVPGSGTATVTSTGRSILYNNSLNQCHGWVFTYYSSGFSAVSIEIDGSNDGGITWTTITAATGSVCTNPAISTGSCNVTTDTYYKGISLAYTLTGTGSLTYRAYGAAGVTASKVGAGGGGGGTITAVTGTSPIVSSGGTTPAISCPTCLTSASSVPFGNISTGNNALATMTVNGSGVLTFSGTGQINANEINGGTMPVSQPCIGTNGSGQPINGTCGGGASVTQPYLAAGGNSYAQVWQATIPPLSSWTTDNTPAGSSLDTTDGYPFFHIARASGTGVASVWYRTAPGSTPWSVAVRANVNLENLQNNSGEQFWSIGFRDSSGKLETMQMGFTGGDDPEVLVCRFTTSTSVNSCPFMLSSPKFSWITSTWQPPWVKIQDDGTNLNYYLSMDGGLHFGTAFYSESRTAWFTSGPTQICIGGEPNVSAIDIALLSWTIGT